MWIHDYCGVWPDALSSSVGRYSTVCRKVCCWRIFIILANYKFISQSSFILTPPLSSWVPAAPVLPWRGVGGRRAYFWKEKVGVNWKPNIFQPATHPGSTPAIALGGGHISERERLGLRGATRQPSREGCIYIKTQHKEENTSTF